jgi:F0F1-type ATP synthase membrane subunit b/b'
MGKLEKVLVDNRDDVEYELKQANEKKLDPQLIDNLEKKLVQVKAQLRFVGEDAEAALKQKDEDLRAKLPGQTNEKKRKTTNRSTCNKKKRFLG